MTTSDNIDEVVQKVADAITDACRDLNLPDYVAVLEEIASNVRTLLTAAREDMQ